MDQTNFSAPLVDQFDSLIEKIAYEQVKSWDQQKLFSYAVDQLSSHKKNHHDLESLVEDFEDIFLTSIIVDIQGWNVTPVPYNEYKAVMFRGMISVQNGRECSLYALEPELTESREDILFWSIFLQASDKENLCILNVANHEEAELISHSIFDHCYSE
jgi:hypothetical protein